MSDKKYTIDQVTIEIDGKGVEEFKLPKCKGAELYNVKIDKWNALIEAVEEYKTACKELERYETEQTK